MPRKRHNKKPGDAQVQEFIASQETETCAQGQESEQDEEPADATSEKSGSAKKQQSSSMCGRCFGILKYVVLILLVPPFVNYAALHKEQQELQPPGALYDIGYGQKLYLGCNGTGSPTVILDAPTGFSSDVWTLVHREVAKITKVCVYDRAGLGFSDRPYKNYSDSLDDGQQESSGQPAKNRWQESTVERMADDLYRLISYSSQQEKPFIMVGSEMGALVARFYTTIYEGDVSDLVLVDPLVENIFHQDDGIWTHFWFGHLMPSFQSMQLSAAIGVTRLALLLGLMEQPLDATTVPEEVIRRQKYLMCHPRHLSAVVDEHHFVNDTFKQIDLARTLKPFPEKVSVTVITGNYYDEQFPSSLNKAWAKSQQHLISHLHPGSNHIVVNGADHKMLYRHPEAIVEPIKRLIRQRRQKNKTQSQSR